MMAMKQCATCLHAIKDNERWITYGCDSEDTEPVTLCSFSCARMWLLEDENESLSALEEDDRLFWKNPQEDEHRAESEAEEDESEAEEDSPPGWAEP